MKRTCSILVVLAVLALAKTAHAQITPERFTVSGLFGGYVFAKSEELKNSTAWGLRLGYDLSTRWGIEAAYDYVPSERRPGTRDYVDAYLYHLDGLYYLSPEERLVPFLAAGLGGTYRDPTDGLNNTDIAFNFGAGLKYFFTPRLAGRADLRDYVNFNEQGILNNFEYTVGLTYVFDRFTLPRTAKAPAAAPSPKPQVVVGDDDQDGVANDMDRCPGTPPGTPVDADGCPKDSDKDGVPDFIDECPNTPPGVPVDSRGCPKDSDGDGVPDYLDKCPGTAPGLRVDEAGCPVLEKKLSIDLNIQFDSGQADINSKYEPKLREVADFLKTYPNSTAEIEGHTDNTGSFVANVALSQSRAESVVKYLVEKLGVDGSRLTAKGYGPSRPIADNATPEGRQKNRRVVATFTANP
jgi:OOP family OmpA-OmpF porin